jgi:signal transduction histidine kinase
VLASVNEALSAANQQADVRVDQLATTSCASIKQQCYFSREIATICLERDYNIKWATPGARVICNINNSDVGRNIRLFPTEYLGAGLIEDAESVLLTLEPKERPLELFRKSKFLRRILPYRTEDDQIGGFIVTYTDIAGAEVVADAQQALAESLEARVRERTTRLRLLTAELTLTEERERRDLAQDLHDGLGQFLAILKIKLTSIKESERRGTLKRAFREIEDLIDQANQSIRSLMLQLSPPVLQALGLTPALEWLAEEIERIYKLSVQIKSDGTQIALEEPAKTTIFRAVRELLINVAKHANCDKAQINCGNEAGRVFISVTDQGDGFSYEASAWPNALESGFGLSSIKDRIEYIGGDMSIVTAPGVGATVKIIFPATHSSENPNAGEK